ncbi:MAG: hypothetical protein RIS36_2028 [Pseudomonadota bacterium]
MGAMPTFMQGFTDVTDNILDGNDIAKGAGRDTINESLKVLHGKDVDGKPVLALVFRGFALVMDVNDSSDTAIN